MDAALPRLGSGPQSADRIVSRSPDAISVRKTKGRNGYHLQRTPFQPYSVGISSIAKKSNLIPEAGYGRSPYFFGYCQCFNCDAKNSSLLYKSSSNGNTIIRKMNSTKRFIQSFDIKCYISDSYLKDLFPIDTE